jgi:CRP/FNR family transcriptional regulator, anaerobic regulatory protein
VSLPIASAARPGACTRCHLRHSTICGAVPRPDLVELAAATSVIEIPAGTFFIEEGEPATDYFIITRGTATIFKLMPDGRRQIIDFAAAGRLIGPGALDVNEFSAEALEPLRVCRFTRSRFAALLSRHPAMERRLIDIAARALAAARDQMLLLGRKTARERLASFLLALSRQAIALEAPSERVIRLPMSRTDIADYLGLTVETVSRALAQFRTEGVVDFPTPSKLFIRDPTALERMAQGTAPAARQPRLVRARVPAAASGTKGFLKSGFNVCIEGRGASALSGREAAAD